MKTPRQRRVMRKAIKMVKAGQREIADARFYRAHEKIRAARGHPHAHRVALDCAHRALDLLVLIDEVRLAPPAPMMLRVLRRASRRLNARYA